MGPKLNLLRLLVHTAQQLCWMSMLFSILPSVLWTTCPLLTISNQELIKQLPCGHLLRVLSRATACSANHKLSILPSDCIVFNLLDPLSSEWVEPLMMLHYQRKTKTCLPLQYYRTLYIARYCWKQLVTQEKQHTYHYDELINCWVSYHWNWF